MMCFVRRGRTRRPRPRRWRRTRPCTTASCTGTGPRYRAGMSASSSSMRGAMPYPACAGPRSEARARRMANGAPPTAHRERTRGRGSEDITRARCRLTAFLNGHPVAVICPLRRGRLQPAQRPSQHADGSGNGIPQAEQCEGRRPLLGTSHLSPPIGAPASRAATTNQSLSRGVSQLRCLT